MSAVCDDDALLAAAADQYCVSHAPVSRPSSPIHPPRLPSQPDWVTIHTLFGVFASALMLTLTHPHTHTHPRCRPHQTANTAASATSSILLEVLGFCLGSMMMCCCREMALHRDRAETETWQREAERAESPLKGPLVPPALLPSHSQLFFLPRLVDSFVDWDPGLKSKPQAQTHPRKPG